MSYLLFLSEKLRFLLQIFKLSIGLSFLSEITESISHVFERIFDFLMTDFGLIISDRNLLFCFFALSLNLFIDSGSGSYVVNKTFVDNDSSKSL